MVLGSVSIRDFPEYKVGLFFISAHSLSDLEWPPPETERRVLPFSVRRPATMRTRSRTLRMHGCDVGPCSIPTLGVRIELVQDRLYGINC